MISDKGVGAIQPWGNHMNKRLHTCIIIPTYNEASNIIRLLNQIYAIKTGKQDKLSVLVVDDSSPDGTAKLVKLYRHKNKDVHLLLRTEKEGLGAAYIAGMKHAMQTLNPDVIMEMDADGQHDPKDIIRLIDAVRKGADFVIGSRYIPGGSVPKTWATHRKLLSRAANAYTKTVLNTGNVNDCTGGYRAIRTSILRKINLDALNIKGYAFQVTLLDSCLQAGAIAKEIPIAFGERELGASKMRPRDMIIGGLTILGIRAKRLPLIRKMDS